MCGIQGIGWQGEDEEAHKEETYGYAYAYWSAWEAHVAAWQNGDATGEQSEPDLKMLTLYSVLPHGVNTVLSYAKVDFSTHMNRHMNKRCLTLQLHLENSDVCVVLCCFVNTSIHHILYQYIYISIHKYICILFLDQLVQSIFFLNEQLLKHNI